MGQAVHRDPSAEEAAAPTGDTRITARTGRGGFLTEILANGHSLVADEPVRFGGTDQGRPLDLLVAALGASPP
jgi:putative redox protein